ncbi:MAG: hypothetical protein M1825_003662 [Sarcosagium campestre]|nr:MAG: hypothetical protein M1825_003662 [Sarcosagium campestre]
MGPPLHYYDSDYSSSGSQSSQDSDRSRSTAPTNYDPASRPSLKQWHTTGATSPAREQDRREPWASDPRASTETYASTIPSEDDFPTDQPEYEVPQYRPERENLEPIACNPQEFSELFPSGRRLCIQHDDTTEDGNMNLRVDTEVRLPNGRKRDFTLFHLRMHDLKRRDFSLRRYCRESGREVCHSSRKYAKPMVDRRPALQRSVTTALASFRGKQETKESTSGSLRRQDSGYESDELDVSDSSVSPKDISNLRPTNTTRLEFSNYAQVNVKRRGTKASKRYEFEYWGNQYTWKRVVTRAPSYHETSFHLVNSQGAVLAHIVPVALTPGQVQEETEMGGWVTPCSMWISDKGVLNGLTAHVADVIISTGLIALVDDCIKRRFHNKRSVQIVLPHIATSSPSSSPKTTRKHDGGSSSSVPSPKRIIDEVFHRRGPSSHYNRHPPTPLRQQSARA